MAIKKSFNYPEKEETLAIKQEERIRRFYHLRRRLAKFSPRGWVVVLEFVGLIGLFFTSLWLLLPFFGRPDQINVFSAPVVPLLVSLTEKLIPFSYGVRIWLLAFLALFPLSFYYFVREISSRKLIGFISSFIVILPFGVFLPIRVNLSLLAQDGAHMTSLAFTPLVCLLLVRFLRQGGFWTGVLSAFGTTLVALTSPIGFVVLALFMGVVTFSEMLLGQGRLKILRFLVVLILAVGFSAFWYNPQFALLTLQSPQGQLLKKTLSNLLPVSFFLLPILGVFGFLLFENRPQLQPMFIAFFLTIGFGLFSIGAGVAHPSPSRFLPAFGISLAFLLGILVTAFYDFLRASPKLKKFKIPTFRRQLAAFGLIFLVFTSIFIMITAFSQNLWGLEESRVLGLTAEQKVGVWDIKEKTGLVESVFGYLITSLTAAGVIILKSRLGI